MKYLLLLCYFISAILAMLFSTEFYKCVVSYAENTLVEENPSREAETKDFTGTLSLYMHDILMFSYIAMLFLPIAFIALYILQNTASHSSVPISIFLTSGIYVPFILLLSGYIIRQCFHRIVKTHDMFTIPMMKKAIMYMALTCDIALILLNLTLGLFVLAIILGKFIWIDFVYDEAPIQTLFMRIINDYKQEKDPTYLFLFYALWFLVSFFIAATIYYECIYLWHLDAADTRNRMLLYICCEISITICSTRILRCVAKNHKKGLR